MKERSSDVAQERHYFDYEGVYDFLSLVGILTLVF